jgi:hypothetical protein
MSSNSIDIAREPRRLDLPDPAWSELSAQDKEGLCALADQAIDEVGIVIVAGALSPSQCDEFAGILYDEIRTGWYIERQLHQKAPVQKVYDFQSRHPAAMDLIALPFVVDYMRRFLGQRMVLHSSERVTVAPHAPEPPHGGLQFDGYDRVQGYLLSMNAIYYLCDADVTNGATKYIPGTHKEFLSLAEAERRSPNHITVKKGDLVLFNPYLLHGSSGNPSDEHRPVIINYYQRGYIKQGFDFPRSIGLSQLKRLTEDQRTLLGYDHRVPLDVRELYLFKSEVANLDPLYGRVAFNLEED